jgi:hypothetical protein
MQDIDVHRGTHHLIGALSSPSVSVAADDANSVPKLALIFSSTTTSFCPQLLYCRVLKALSFQQWPAQERSFNSRIARAYRFSEC